jgi:hypothetical protein
VSEAISSADGSGSNKD